jgi:hypothetical protein
MSTCHGRAPLFLKHEILELANNKDFGRVEWVEEKVSGKKNWKHRKIKNEQI